MYSGLPIIICSIIYSVLLLSVYFSKKHIKSFETKIYNILVIISLLSLLLEFVCCFLVPIRAIVPIINTIANNLFLVSMQLWVAAFTIYIFHLSHDNNTKFFKKILILFLIINIILSIIIFILPILYYSENGIVYSYGPATNFLLAIGGVYSIWWVFSLIRNSKKISIKKYIPVFALIVLIIFAMIIRMINPSITIIASILNFTTFLMYFTIENPDMKMIEQLNYERDRADKANEAKSEFLSSMSHEIRTPLNAIVGFSEALKEESLPKEAEDEVNDIIMASESLVEIVNGILDISKIEANRLEIINVPYSFKKIFDDLVVLTKARLGDKALEFRVSYDESIPGVLYGDASRLKQIILNLLTNAVKYTNTGYFEFKVNSVIKDDICRLIISVEDSGIGIKKESIDKLFTKFERLQVEKQTTVEGTGLGLAITKKLVELMNGKIVVQSEYGKGSKFTVAIDQYIIKREISEVEEVKKEELEIIDASNKKILVVDDNIVNLKVATRLLLKYKAIIDTATSGNECIDKVMANHYDLILMDDMMPKMSGTETLNNLKEIKDFNIPTVALTANAISGMKEKYLNEGFSDYLSKPIELKELNRVIIKFLK